MKKKDFDCVEMKDKGALKEQPRGWSGSIPNFLRDVKAIFTGEYFEAITMGAHRIRSRVEIPLEARPYEESWELAPGLCRFNIGAVGGVRYKDFCSTFTHFIDAIRDDESQFVMEFWELFTSMKKIPLLANYEVVDASEHVSAGDTIVFGENDQKRMYTIVGGSYCSLLCPREALAELFRSINAVEIVLTGWNVNPARAEMLGPGIKDCSEPISYYVQNIGDFDPVICISRDHRDMEIYTKNQRHIKTILDCLSLFED